MVTLTGPEGITLAESNRITLTDMAVHGANPARIIPLLLEWLERSTAPMRVLAEPLWAGRSQAESVEVLRHEALIEAALGATRAKLVCVYEEGVLSECHRRSLERSHHAIIDADGSLRERAVEPHSVPELLGSGPPLESPCEPVERLAVTSDLRRMRRQGRSRPEPDNKMGQTPDDRFSSRSYCPEHGKRAEERS